MMIKVLTISLFILSTALLAENIPTTRQSVQEYFEEHQDVPEVECADFVRYAQTRPEEVFCPSSSKIFTTACQDAGNGLEVSFTIICKNSFTCIASEEGEVITYHAPFIESISEPNICREV